jgi:dipeptide transport system substrate-binding protein|nr:ABC transporter substrate-binding protein [uncultured Albidiferax sp.]
MTNLSKLVLALGLTVAAVSSHAAGTLVYCSEASPEGFDTAQYTGGQTFDAAGHALFNRLVEFEKGSTKVVPSLSESWTSAPDGLTYTFKLRKGVKFHTTEYFTPSRDFNADDVVLTFMRMVNKQHPFTKAYPAVFPYASDTGLDSNVVSVSKTDDYTVVFLMKKPDPDLLAKLAMPAFSVQSAEYVGKLMAAGTPALINQQPVGTGPFILKRYQKDSQIRYAGNKQYWDPKAVKIDNLIFAITTDASVRVQKLKAGECQIMSYPKPQDLAGLKTEPSLKMISAPGFNIGYLSYNTEKPTTGKLEVRQALDMAINRKAIIDAVYQGQGQEATNPFPSSLWSYNPALKNPPVDVEKAKELLKKAGYPDGFEMTLWSMPVQRPYNPNAKLMAEMIQADWAKIGVKAKIVSYEWGEYLKRMKAGEHDAGLIGWTADYASPDNFLGVLLTCEAVGGSNYARYCSKEFDGYTLKARSTTDPKERTALYMKAQEVFKRDMPWSTIAHSTVNQPMAKGVEGFKISPFGDYNFTYVSNTK